MIPSTDVKTIAETGKYDEIAKHTCYAVDTKIVITSQKTVQFV